MNKLMLLNQMGKETSIVGSKDEVSICPMQEKEFHSDVVDGANFL